MISAVPARLPGCLDSCVSALSDAGGNYCYYTMIDAMIYKLGYLQPHQPWQALTTPGFVFNNNNKIQIKENYELGEEIFWLCSKM